MSVSVFFPELKVYYGKLLIGSGCHLGWRVGSVEWWVY